MVPERSAGRAGGREGLPRSPGLDGPLVLWAPMWCQDTRCCDPGAGERLPELKGSDIAGKPGAPPCTPKEGHSRCHLWFPDAPFFSEGKQFDYDKEQTRYKISHCHRERGQRQEPREVGRSQHLDRVETESGVVRATRPSSFRTSGHSRVHVQRPAHTQPLVLRWGPLEICSKGSEIKSALIKSHSGTWGPEGPCHLPAALIVHS